MGIRVLFITYATGFKGHGKRYVSELTSRIAARGRFVPVVICPEGFRKYFDGDVGRPTDVEIFEITGLDFSRFEASHFRKYGVLAPMFRGLTKHRLCRNIYDAVFHYLKVHPETKIVHMEGYDYHRMSRVWNHVTREFPGVRKAVTVHTADFRPSGWSIPEVYKRLVRGPFRRALELSNAIHVHGEHVADSLMRQLNLNSETRKRIFVTQYGAEERDLRIQKDKARSILNIPLRAKVALCFGNVRRDKRLDVAIAAAGKVEQLWLVIAGSCESVSEVQVRSWIGRAGLQDRSVLHLNYIPEQDIRIYYSAADVFLSTHWEGFGATSGPLNDCRTYRLPAVVSDCGELSGYISRNRIGFLARPEDPNDFSAKLNVFFALRQEDREVILANLEAAAHRYSWAAMSMGVETMYSSTLGCT